MYMYVYHQKKDFDMAKTVGILNDKCAIVGKKKVLPNETVLWVS